MVGDQKRFNREMDDYIRSRRQDDSGNSSVFSFSFGGKSESEEESVPEVDDDSVHVYESEDTVTFWEKVTDWIFGTYEEEPVDETPREELSAREKKKLAEMQGTEVEVEEVDDDDYKELDELDVPKPTFFDKLFHFLGFGEVEFDDDYDEYEEIEDFDPDQFAEDESERLMWEEDVKEIIKIAHSWIERLPKETKKEFKNSEDFVKYRELLDKLNLLKK